MGVELAQSVDSLSTLVTAVVAGGLADTLSTGGPFTVFAPSNDAFGTIGDSLDNLLKAENKDVLVELLLNHVVDGTLKAADLDIGSKNLKTLSGGRLSTSYYGFEGDFARVCVVAGGLSCHYLTKAGSDNVASNGIVHIVDGVLVPDYGKLELTNKLASSNIVGLAQSLDSLMKPANKGQLVDILTYHVLSGKVLSTDLDLFQEVTTVEGKKLKIQVFGGKVQVGASLSSAD